MNAHVSLSDPASAYHDEVIINDISDANRFSYLDNEGCLCEIIVSEKGLCLFRKSPDHLLDLYLDGNNYAEIITDEGKVRFDVKVLDFENKSDILVMRYLINDEERLITIRYY